MILYSVVRVIRKTGSPSPVVLRRQCFLFSVSCSCGHYSTCIALVTVIHKRGAYASKPLSLASHCINPNIVVIQKLFKPQYSGLFP